MESLRTPEIRIDTVWRTILVTDARDSSHAYFHDRADQALIRIESDRALFLQVAMAYGGEEVRDRGDGSMFAFTDPLAAVQAAMAMQSEVARLNAAGDAEDFPLVHRMGVHMGQIKLATTRLIHHGMDSVRRKLSGDIVVVASRLQEVCHPGEVCLSNEVYRAVHERIDHEFRFLDATLKGFDRPRRLWSTRLDPDWTRPLTAEEEESRKRRSEERRLRERWEAEHRESEQRSTILKVAIPIAICTVLFASLRILHATSFGKRMDRAWFALLGETQPTPVLPATPPPSYVATASPMPILEMPAASKAVARPKRKNPKPRVASVLRLALNQGRFEEAEAKLGDLELPQDEYQSLYGHLRKVERARDWLSVRLATDGDTSTAVPLQPEVAGLSFLTRAGEVSVAGLDDADRERTILYAQIPPVDLRKLLTAASGTDGADECPETPAEVAFSLAVLQKRMRNR